MSYMWSRTLILTGDMDNDLLTPTDVLSIRYLSIYRNICIHTSPKH